jgi:prophage regulatory protein
MAPKLNDDGSRRLSSALRAIKRKQVEERTGSTRSTLYRWIANGTFPRPIRLGSRSVAWLEHEVGDWLAQRALARDGEAIK